MNPKQSRFTQLKLSVQKYLSWVGVSAMLVAGPFINQQQQQHMPKQQTLPPPRILQEVAPLDPSTPPIALITTSTKVAPTPDKTSHITPQSTHLKIIQEQVDVQLRISLHQDDISFPHQAYQERLKTLSELSATLETSSH